jgi:hypothetical protein
MHDMRSRASQTSIVDARGKTGHKLTANDKRIGLVPAKLPPGFEFGVAKPKKPTAGETAIEAPFRLFISPSTLNGTPASR